MSEGHIINKSENPVTIKSIVKDLRAIGIKSGDLLLVHSSLPSIGWVCGGPRSVIEALLQCIGDTGTLIMPAHSGDLSDPAKWENPPVPNQWLETIYNHMPVFEKDKTPTRGMGSIAELFRRYPKVIRSNHPQVSFCGRGPKALEILSNHPLSPQFGKDSPLGKLYDLNAKILLLGVDYNSCTSFHLAEAFYKEMPKRKYGTPLLINGERKWHWFEDLNYDSDDFTNIGCAFELENKISIGRIGQGLSKCFYMRKGVDFAYKYLKNNRF